MSGLDTLDRGTSKPLTTLYHPHPFLSSDPSALHQYTSLKTTTTHVILHSPLFSGALRGFDSLFTNFFKMHTLNFVVNLFHSSITGSSSQIRYSFPRASSSTFVCGLNQKFHTHVPTKAARPCPNLVYCNAETETESAELIEQLSIIKKLQNIYIDSINQATDLDQLNKYRVAALGKKGEITSILKSLGKMPKNDRPKIGAAVNLAKEELEALIIERKAALEDEADQREIDETPEIDITMPGIPFRPTIGHTHPLTATMQKATDIFIELGYELVDDPNLNREIEDDYHNFTALNCPEEHPARGMQDTFYLDDNQKTLLRTHTSAVQIRYMEQNKPPFAIIAPGRVYRKDDVDATHSPQFHQVEIMCIGETINLGQLRATVIHFLQKMFGEQIEIRFRPSFFPFTEPSMEVDVFFKGKWLEVLGCGMVHPKVLTMAGIDPKQWQGFAAGFGIERFAMVMKEISDIREFTVNDHRFLRQFDEF